jgi:hypothetical protein
MADIIAIQDVRDEGVTSSDADDARVTYLIGLATQYIRVATGGGLFTKETLTFKMDGPGGRVLFLPIPIISLTSIKIESVTLDSSSYVVYNRIGPPFDDRYNPKVVMKSSPEAAYYGDNWFVRRKKWDDPVFPYGQQNIELSGDFGFVEDSSGTVCSQIKQLALALVIREVKLLTDKSRKADQRKDRIVSESIGDYSYSLEELAKSGEPTGDPYIDQIIADYHVPIKVSMIP